MEAVRRLALARTELANATAGTIRLKLLKIGAVVTVSVRCIKFAFPSACPTKRGGSATTLQRPSCAPPRSPPGFTPGPDPANHPYSTWFHLPDCVR